MALRHKGAGRGSERMYILLASLAQNMYSAGTLDLHWREESSRLLLTSSLIPYAPLPMLVRLFLLQKMSEN